MGIDKCFEACKDNEMNTIALKENECLCYDKKYSAKSLLVDNKDASGTKCNRMCTLPEEHYCGSSQGSTYYSYYSVESEKATNGQIKGAQTKGIKVTQSAPD